MPRLLVFGAGAIGQWIAARFASGGADVTVLCRPAAREAIARRGMRVGQSDGTWVDATVRAVDSLDDVAAETFDWVLITVKAFDVAKAMDELAAHALLPPQTRVMGFQNGVGTEDAIAAHGPERSFVCVVTRPIALTDRPGKVVEASSRGGIAVAPYVPGATFDDLDAVLARCGLLVSRFDDQRVMKWSKLLLNMTANATCAILDYTPSELYASGKLFAVERAALVEALDVMRAMGARPVDLPGYPASKLSLAMKLPPRIGQLVLEIAVGKARGSKQPSLRLEMERPRPQSEVDWLNGAVVTAAARYGKSAPANAFLTLTLNAVVQGRIPWDAYRRNAPRFIDDFVRAVQQNDPAPR